MQSTSCAACAAGVLVLGGLMVVATTSASAQTADGAPVAVPNTYTSAPYTPPGPAGGATSIPGSNGSVPYNSHAPGATAAPERLVGYIAYPGRAGGTRPATPAAAATMSASPNSFGGAGATATAADPAALVGPDGLRAGSAALPATYSPAAPYRAPGVNGGTAAGPGAPANPSPSLPGVYPRATLLPNSYSSPSASTTGAGAGAPSTPSYWGPNYVSPAEAAASQKPSFFKRIANLFEPHEGADSKYTYRDPATGRTNLPLAKPWLSPAP